MKKKTLIIVGILLVLFIVIIIPLVLNTLFKYDLGIGFIRSEWDAGYALTYFGSIIGGALTLLGVYVTIKNNRIEKLKDDAIRYKPILTIDRNGDCTSCGYRDVGFSYVVNGDSSHKDLIEHFLKSQWNNKSNDDLYIKNAGRGEACNVFIEPVSIGEFSWKEISGIRCNYSTPLPVGEIIADGGFCIKTHLPEYLILPSEPNLPEFTFTTNISIKYNDMFDVREYMYDIITKYSVRIQRYMDTNEAPDVTDTTYNYARVLYKKDAIMTCRSVYSYEKGDYIRE